MSLPNGHREFLSLPIRDYPSDDDLRRSHVQPALDTLFSEFARRHRSLSPSTQSSPRSVRGQPRHSQQPAHKHSTIDLRALEYSNDYDAHLMCPICHIPFIDPVVLDCDHTFCASCFDEYRHGATNSERAQCPSCRTLVLTDPHKASRLIYNMCNDTRVRCPNENCTVITARGYIERHATKDCPEHKLACPDSKCEQQTKRKNYVHGQCVHNARVECDCGAVIELGRDAWLIHKDQHCPHTKNKCEQCGERVSGQDHTCWSISGESRCPGMEFGCVDEVLPEALEQHIVGCIFARLSSHLRSQSRLLQSMQEQLLESKMKNQALETDLERMNDLLANQIQPQLDRLSLAPQFSQVNNDTNAHDAENDVEEIPRESIPSAAAIHHRDLLLPAHIRDLTPSPDFYPGSEGPLHPHAHVDNQTHMHNHLLSLHESLRHAVSNLEGETHSLHRGLTELDARMSMQLMNETMRIKEEIAVLNAALFRDRSQVQWLLNRERIGREQAILRERGLVGGHGQIPQNQTQAVGDTEGQSSNVSSPAPNAHHQQSQSDSFPFPGSSVGMNRTVSGNGGGSGLSSASTSPMFTGARLAGSAGSTRRPSVRGGSQERVKL